jgi:cellulose synthase/poly-beta-1,6-N-acetylglucosamine synthase-like glycosyltransferase
VPFLPGYAAMPTTLMNAVLGLTRDDELVVRGPDRLAVVSPMFDEEDGAGPALRSLLGQSHPPDEIAISINGGADATPRVVADTLTGAGYARVEHRPIVYLDVTIDRWAPPGEGPEVTVLQHAAPTSKSDGVNFAVAGGFVTADRILIVDGDTRFHPDFVRALRDGFYRLHREHRDGRLTWVLDDVGLQSGAVDSLRPGRRRPLAGLISRARSGEYALAALLRNGQTRRLGQGRTFGSTRLFTAVGCGFAARRDAFPMPSDTWTEDHDFTLRVQNDRDVERTTDPETLHARGFRVVTGGREASPRELFDAGDAVVVRRTSGARFVDRAIMYTEDPPSLGGYLRQVERWNGGGIENALKRTTSRVTWAEQRPNVRFTVAAAQIENLLGVLLLLAMPVALGLYVGAPGIGGTAVSGLGTWVGLDLLATFVLVYLGARRLERARGHGGASLAARAAGTAAMGVPPLMALRILNVISLLAAAVRIVPRYARGRRRRRPAMSRTWVRARVRRGVTSYLRFGAVALALVALGTTNYEATRRWATFTWPDDRTVSALVEDARTIDQDAHRQLPLAPPTPEPQEEVEPPRREAGPKASAGAVLGAVAWRALSLIGGVPQAAAIGWTDAEGSELHGVSRFCSPSFLAAPAPEARRFGAGSTEYEPLGPWGLLTLARAAPLVGHLEEAATAYDVPPELLLQVLLNESYLDPLAVGPTNDLGLSQMTTDTLTLLGAMARDADSPFANPRLFPDGFSAFDPDFSICAGAAMLSWSRSLPGGGDDAVAYARYINPRHGVVRGEVGERHRPLVDAMLALSPMVDALSATIASYRRDPGSVAPDERALLDVARDVATGRIGIGAGYARVAETVAELGIDDMAFYRDVLERLYGRTDLGAPPPATSVVS